MQNVLLAVLVAASGLAVFGYLAGLLWQAAAGPILGALERGRLRRFEDLVERGDQALRAGDTPSALRSFASALYLSPARSASFAAQVAKHHTGLLSRFIAASDRRHGENVGVISLAVADRMLRKRKVIQSSYIAALQTGDSGRRRALESELRNNSRQLRKALADLAAEVLANEAPAALH